MQPYRKITPNHFLPIYWTDCRQCSCENCVCRELRENTRSSPTPNAEVRTSTSFTIESLLSRKDERKSADVKPCLESASTLNMALVSSATAQFPNGRTSELIHSSTGYLTSFRPQSFGFEQVSLLARGNIQTNGKWHILAIVMWSLFSDIQVYHQETYILTRKKGSSNAIQIGSISFCKTSVTDAFKRNMFVPRPSAFS